jgi:hypothetical protein
MRQRVLAMLVGSITNVLCALVFWSVWLSVGSASLLSFWDRPWGVTLALVLLFVLLGARVQIWYTRKVHSYMVQRQRGPVRILPLAFGLAVFGMVVTWLGVTFVVEAGFRSYRMLLAPSALDRTVVFMPLLSFIQFLFSRSTIVWLLGAGVFWTVAARHVRVRELLLGYYPPTERDPAQETSLAFVRVWNLIGYLLFILSLLFQVK